MKVTYIDITGKQPVVQQLSLNIYVTIISHYFKKSTQFAIIKTLYKT